MQKTRRKLIKNRVPKKIVNYQKVTKKLRVIYTRQLLTIITKFKKFKTDFEIDTIKSYLIYYLDLFKKFINYIN